MEQLKQTEYIKTESGYYHNFEEWKHKVGHKVIQQTEMIFEINFNFK